MAVKVAGERYESVTGQLFEIGRQLRQPNGYPFDPAELQKFLQRAVEGRFIDGVVVKPASDYLTPLYAGKVIYLSETRGPTRFTEATDVFDLIDRDFVDYGTNKPSRGTNVNKLQVFELSRNGTFAQLFGSLGDLDRLTLTQWQIIAYCRQHRDKLRQDGYATFFLFRVGNERFVACVLVEAGRLQVYCNRFSYDVVWSAVNRLHVVVPQLAT